MIGSRDAIASKNYFEFVLLIQEPQQSVEVWAPPHLQQSQPQQQPEVCRFHLKTE